MPTPRFCVAGKVIDFALVTVGLRPKNGSLCPEQGHWKPTPMFCAAGTSGVTTVQTCIGGGALAAKLSAYHSNSSKVYRREEKAASLYIRRVVLLLLQQRRGAAGLGEL
jgi:hypothetical protein